MTGFTTQESQNRTKKERTMSGRIRSRFNSNSGTGTPEGPEAQRSDLVIDLSVWSLKKTTICHAGLELFMMWF